MPGVTFSFLNTTITKSFIIFYLVLRFFPRLEEQVHFTLFHHVTITSRHDSWLPEVRWQPMTSLPQSVRPKNIVFSQFSLYLSVSTPFPLIFQFLKERYLSRVYFTVFITHRVILISDLPYFEVWLMTHYPYVCTHCILYQKWSNRPIIQSKIAISLTQPFIPPSEVLSRTLT